MDTAYIAANRHVRTYVAMQLHTIITLIHLVSNCLERPCVLTLEAAQDKTVKTCCSRESRHRPISVLRDVERLSAAVNAV